MSSRVSWRLETASRRKTARIFVSTIECVVLEATLPRNWSLTSLCLIPCPALLDQPVHPSHQRHASSSSLASTMTSATYSHSQRSPEDLATLYSPLSLACNSKNPALCAVAVDCLGKLFAYGYWGAQSGEIGRTSLDDLEGEAAAAPNGEAGQHGGVADYPDLVVDLISSCFSTPLPPVALQLQIVKSLVAAVSAPGGVHGSTLLKCIRTLYNVFLLSSEAEVQVVAQGGVSQAVSVIMGRVPVGGWDFESMEDHEPLTPATPTTESGRARQQEPISVTQLKDAFLLLRALLKLAMKPLPPPTALDLRSHPMRSKLLSLSLIQSVLIGTPHVLSVDAGPLFKEGGGVMAEAVKQYLCVGLARNLASAVPQVYDVSLDIFVRVVGSSVRGVLKVGFCRSVGAEDRRRA